MQQLKSALMMLADRAEELPADALIARLEAQIDADAASPGDVIPAADLTRTQSLRAVRSRGRAWRGPAVAAGTAVAILAVVAAVALLRGDSTDSVDVVDEPTATTSPDSTTATTVPTETAGWNPVLADTRAKVAPMPATCPPSATPATPGPSDQARPHSHWVQNLPVAFDRHAGRIVYVDTFGETWTFDVCTNTWHQMNPDFRPVPGEELYDAAGEPSGFRGQLVYDVDSDVTIALGYGVVSVYDANTNTWSERAVPHEDYTELQGAVYDPISGQVITSIQDRDAINEWDLWAYNVDTDDWALLGPVTLEGACCPQIDLLGYANDIDRLILFTTYYEDSAATILVDPRTGEMTIIQIDADTPLGYWGSGWGWNWGWPGPVYGPANATVYVYTPYAYARLRPAERAICWFDAESRTWPCHPTPPDVPAQDNPFSAVVGDPINNRLVLINGVHGDWWPATNDLWSIDLASGQWTHIFAPSSE